MIKTQEKSRSTLEGFVSYSVLLAGIYFFVGSVFQQTYLRALGIRVGLIDLSQLIPNFTDPIVISYSLVLWIVLSRLPERWLSRIAELANFSLWRNPQNIFFRSIGIVVTYLIFQLMNIYQINNSGIKPVSQLEFLLPHSAFLSQVETFWLCVLLGIILLIIYLKYAQIRRKQLNEITKRNRKTLLVILYGVVPPAVIYCAITFSFIFPANYGNFKAKTDIQRLFGSNLALVEDLVIASESCVPSTPSPNISDSTFLFSPQPDQEVHFLGSYGGNQMFIIFNNQSSSDDFEICIVNGSILKSIQLAKN